MLSVQELFKRGDLILNGSEPWPTPIDERGPGVYVIALGRDADAERLPECLPLCERPHWIAAQQIIYIGRSRHLRRRLKEFYKHKYPNKRPHCGGQAVTLLKCPLSVYWSPAVDYAGTEHRLIEIFKAEVGRLPFGNRVRSARLRLSGSADLVP